MKKSLQEIYQDTLDGNPQLQQTLADVMSKLGMAMDDVFIGFQRYDSDIGTYDNRIYDDMCVRAALYFKYFVIGSYHVDRQRILIEFIRNCGKIKTIVDIGYGAPGCYVNEYVLRVPGVELTLCDAFESAETFSRALFESLFPRTDWKMRIHFQCFDLNQGGSLGPFDAYILFDSIEHASNPTATMVNIVKDASKTAHFILSLPICSMKEIPHLHFIEWLTENAAVDWLHACGLRIVDRQTVVPAPIDTWSDHFFQYHNLIVRCTKA